MAILCNFFGKLEPQFRNQTALPPSAIISSTCHQQKLYRSSELVTVTGLSNISPWPLDLHVSCFLYRSNTEVNQMESLAIKWADDFILLAQRLWNSMQLKCNAHANFAISLCVAAPLEIDWLMYMVHLRRASTNPNKTKIISNSNETHHNRFCANKAHQ